MTRNISVTPETENTKVALMVGASGLVGKHLLLKLLASPRYSKVIALVRTPLKLENEKLEQWQIDFEQLDTELASHGFASENQQQENVQSNNSTKIDHIFCTLGTTIKKAGAKPAFSQVDYQYPLCIAEFFYRQQAELFAIVSAMGANKNARVFYSQVKGKIETDLSNIGYQHLGIFRPSMLAGQRDEFRLGEQFGTILMNAFAFVIPKKYQVIQAEKVANAMLAYTESPTLGVAIVESDQLQNY
ncbi:MAG: SDR family oxidoreductase [Cognaticolwellia sp.]